MLLRDTKGLSSCTEKLLYALRFCPVSLPLCLVSSAAGKPYLYLTLNNPNVSTRKHVGSGYRVLAINTDTKTICIAIACLEYSYLNTLKYMYVAVAILTTHVI